VPAREAMIVPRALVLAALAGCANLAEVAPSCGNGFLDPGEDCDVRDDPRCVSCGWTCTTDAHCADSHLPGDAAGYAVGGDRVCQAPGGVLGPQASAQLFPVQSFFITDVDHDGIGDAVGLSDVSIVTRLGDPEGQLALTRSTLTPASTGAPAIVDLDR